MANITHGAQSSKAPTSVSSPNVAATGIAFAVGAAPVHTVDGKVNEVIMLNNWEEAVTALGYSDDWKNYGLSEVIYTMFKLYKVSPVFVVNVLDPAKHKKTGTTTATPVDNQIKLPISTIDTSVKITGKKVDEDFAVFYDDENCIVEFLKDNATETTVTYDEVDPSAVTKNDIIGGFSKSTHKHTGLDLIDSVYPKYTYAPDLILCPNWSHDPEVAAVMAAKGENINEVFSADAILDVNTAEVGYYTEVPAWKKSKNFSRTNELVCFPHVALGDKIFNYSSQLAGLMAQVDNTDEYGGGTPCESASNKTLQADSAVLADGTEVIMDLQGANYLNDNGVITALNFAGSFTSWGNYTAAFPTSTDPVDYFYCISRMFKWVGKTVVQSYWSKLDRKLTRRLIDAILEGVNTWLRGLTAEEKILGGRVELREEENTLTALMAGRAKFHISLTPPSPLQKLDFVLEYDVSYLQTSLLAA